MIELYTFPTPNGHKVSCTLEAMELDYKVHVVNIAEGEQKNPEYVALNPNGRIPTIVDKDNDDFTVFESGAIMLYLAEKTGKLIPSELNQRTQVIQWLMFQMAGIGPMMGQANVFYRYFPEKIPVVIDRYQRESRRLFEVLDNHLHNNQWLAGEYSIADIANWCWVRTHKWSGVSLDGLSKLQEWMSKVSEQPGMHKGIQVPFNLGNLLEDEEAKKKFTSGAQTILQ